MAAALIKEFLIVQLEIATIRDSPNNFIQVIPKYCSIKEVSIQTNTLKNHPSIKYLTSLNLFLCY